MIEIHLICDKCKEKKGDSISPAEMKAAPSPYICSECEAKEKRNVEKKSLSVKLERLSNICKLPVCKSEFDKPGGMIDASGDWPTDDPNLLLLCVNRGGGYSPERVLLPHQVYMGDIYKLLVSDSGIYSVTVFPLRGKEAIELFPDTGSRSILSADEFKYGKE